MSKVFIEWKKFHFIGQIVKHDGFWDLLLDICQLWYPLFWLLRLADMRGGIDKVKYYICQIDLLMEAALNKVMKKWSAPSCPANKIWSASMRRLDKSYEEGNPKTEGLDNEGDFGDMVSSFVFDNFFNICDLTIKNLHQNQAWSHVQRRIPPMKNRRNHMKPTHQRKSNLNISQS